MVVGSAPRQAEAGILIRFRLLRDGHIGCRNMLGFEKTFVVLVCHRSHFGPSCSIGSFDPVARQMGFSIYSFTNWHC